MPVYQIRIPATIYEERPGGSFRVSGSSDVLVLKVEAEGPGQAAKAVEKAVSDAAVRALEEPFTQALLEWDPRDDMTPGSY